MTSLPIQRFGRALACSVSIAVLAACGGGGADPAPAPAPNSTLGPTAGSVVSSDGKVTVSVGDNALQAPVSISIAPAMPDAVTAADATLVPGTTYLYTAPDLQVPEQVMITIESPLAVSALAAPDRKRSLAAPPGYVPPPTCLVNAPGVLAGTQALQNIYVSGSQCPVAPAPACVKIDVLYVTTQSLCAPAEDVLIVPYASLSICPEGYSEVTGDPAFATLASLYGNSRICLRHGVSAPPVLTKNGTRTTISCSVKGGKFLCPAPILPSGTYSVVWDRTPPPQPTFGRQQPFGPVTLTEGGPPGSLSFRITASDPEGLGGIEVVEVLNSGSVVDGIQSLPTRQVWRADPSLFEGTAVKQFDSGVFSIPYTLADLPSRYLYARVYDRAGNSTKSAAQSGDSIASVITIGNFTVTPATVAPPNGNVTLSWSVKGAASASIDQGVGAISVTDSLSTASTGSQVVNVAASKTFTLTATHPTRGTKTATATVTLSADTTAPSVSLAASPLAVVAPGSTTLTASANDMVGVTKVEFFRGATLIGTDTSAPYEQTVAFTPADIGSAAFTAKAFDAANNSTTSAVVTVTIGADVTPPTINLLANPATVLVPGSTTLQATATDAIGVTKVEFYRGATLIATDTSAPYQTQVDFTAADLGNVSFTAKAFDAQNNNSTSTPTLVLVTTPSSGDTYASPTGIDTGNNSCSQAAPCLTIAKAALLAQATKTVWLNNGNYTSVTQPALINFPAGLTLRALTPGLAQVSRGIVLQGSATVVGVVIGRLGLFDTGFIAASSGTVVLDGVKVVGSAFTGSGLNAAITLSGTVQATMTPGNIADYADQLTPVGQGAAAYATLADSARLNVNGGVFGGAALGGSANLYGPSGAFTLTGSSRLDINNAVVGVDSYGVVMKGNATQLNMTGSVLSSNANSGFGGGVFAAAGTPQVTLVGSVISGFAINSGSRGISVGPVGNVGLPGVAATVTMANSTLNMNDFGVWVADGTTPSSLTLTGSNVTIGSNTFGGVVCPAACNIDIAGGEIADNGTQNPALVGAWSFYGGVWLGSATKNYSLKLRNVQVDGNKSLLGGNSNQPDNSGVTMAGAAASTYDLGTLASPGGNVFAGNNTGSQTTNLNVAVAAGVTVSAVGNTFTLNVQQADAQGKYKLGTAPCGASSCNLTTGTGANYRISSGTLRLAE